MFFHDLKTGDSTRLFVQNRWRHVFGSIVIGLISTMFYLWLLNLPTSVYANFGMDVVFVDTDNKTTISMAWGDYDGDYDLDLAIGNDREVNQVYQNDGKGNFMLVWESTGDAKRTNSIAWGDYDGDGDLDLAVGNREAVNQVYENKGDANFSLAWESIGDAKATWSVAWGDYDGDGDLDLAYGNFGDANQIYQNDGNNNFNLAWESVGDAKYTQSIALGDYDNDGYLDLAVGNDREVNQVYQNNGNGDLSLAWVSTDTMATKNIALGDYDNDGDLDLAFANGSSANEREINQVYRNDGTNNFALAWQSTGDGKYTTSVAWGDYDQDGDLDLAFGNYTQNSTPGGHVNQVFQSDGQGNFTLAWESIGDAKDTFAVAWGDMDLDGDLDLATGNIAAPNQVYRNENAVNFRAISELNGDIKRTQSVAWGDYDNDGDLDLAIANERDEANQVYRNEGSGNFTLIWELSNDTEDSLSVAWGDYDNDGDLDLAFGNFDVNEVYRNEAGQDFTLAWSSTGLTWSESIAWGDYDNDGDLDLVVANRGAAPNRIYRNESGSDFILVWESIDHDKDARSVAWGDYDGDGDLDLVFGNFGDWSDSPEVNQVYQNNGMDQFALAWESTGDARFTTTVAWADYDGDGDLDLAIGNYDDVNQIYRNDGAGNFTLAWEPSPNETTRTKEIAWGDYNGDGRLDFAVANDYESNRIYQNEGGDSFKIAWQSPNIQNRTTTLAWGDMDLDGDLDLVFGNYLRVNQILENTQSGKGRLPNNAPTLTINHPDSGANANFYASAEIFTETTIPITYTLFDTEKDPVGELAAFYSTTGGDNWRPAIGTSETITRNLTTSPDGVTHVYTWDTFASGFFGQSDNVTLRFVASPQVSNSNTPNTYQYINSTPGLFQRPAPASMTFPARVRGTQVRVYTDTIAQGNELAGAMIYRLPQGHSTGAYPMVSSPNYPLVTNQNGYLPGRGELGLADQLIALLPITTTENYTLYHTSAAPTLTGLDMFPVSAPGVQELVISSNNPLIVFDLDVSLEWDARNDDIFLTQLQSDLQRTSQILYDLTNGQIALGNIRVYHAKENWLDSHILIYATNNLRPNADLGGILTSPINDVLKNGEVITDAYLPGQVRMSAIWNRFGNPSGKVGEDWPRTLAHELGHYLLFIPDNYLGVSQEGLLVQVDCSGSAMTDPYRDDYSEFLTREEWAGECLNTLAEHTTGRTDWETITSFYKMLDDSAGNTGPSNLPLGVTKVTFVEPETPVNTLSDPFFNVTDENTNPLSLPFGQAQGYLFKTQGTADLTDDYVVLVGSPITNLLRVRGAEPNDRLCLFDYSHTPMRLGCVKGISQSSTNLSLHEAPGWEPQITVNSVTSYTLAITVTQPMASDEQLYVQVLPAAQPTTDIANISPIATMNRVFDTNIFTQTITLDYPIANGFVRVSASGTPLREDITEFFLSASWGAAGDKRAWGPSSHRYGWGVSRQNAWQAPISARDGQVTIFDIEHILGDNPTYTLQLLSIPPDLPSWLTPVGQAYRFSAAEALPSTLNIKFEYLERELPLSREDRLRIYYSPDNGKNWQRLDTILDTHRNQASAWMVGEGIYTIVSTIEIEPFDAGWNTFTYPIPETQAITTTLASIDGKYTSVYYDQPNSSEWLLYDQTIADNHPEFSNFVNNLTHLQDGRSYWIHTTEPTTLYMAPGSEARRQTTTTSGLEFPPATYYGWITPNESFQPTVGMPVKARIGNTVCGESTIEEVNDKLAYKLQVKAENILGQPNGCGTSQRNIVFEVGDFVIEAQRNWDNSQASYYPLPEGLPSQQLYLPLIIKN